MPVTVQELIQDLNKALDLLQVAGPNRFLVDETEYFKELHELLNKYRPDKDDEDGMDKSSGDDDPES